MSEIEDEDGREEEEAAVTLHVLNVQPAVGSVGVDALRTIMQEEEGKRKKKLIWPPVFVPSET